MRGFYFFIELLRDFITIFIIVKLLVMTKKNKVSQQKLNRYSIVSLILLSNWLMNLAEINIFRPLFEKIAIKTLSLNIPILKKILNELTNFILSYDYGEIFFKFVNTALQLLIIVSGIIISLAIIFRNPKIVETNIKRKDYLAQLNSKEADND